MPKNWTTFGWWMAARSVHSSRNLLNMLGVPWLPHSTRTSCSFFPVEHAAEIWWPGGKTADKKMEAVQERIGRRLLGASRTVAGAAVRGDLGWRKLEERREEKKLLYGKRIDNLEDDRLVKIVAEKLKNMGGVGWWEECEVLQRRYGLSEGQEESRQEWKSKIAEINAQNWCEEVEGKNSLRGTMVQHS